MGAFDKVSERERRLDKDTEVLKNAHALAVVSKSVVQLSKMRCRRERYKQTLKR